MKSLQNKTVKDKRIENDFYATEPKAVELLLRLEKFTKIIEEPACGQGHISKVLQKQGHEVISADLIDRGFGEQQDFLKRTEKLKGNVVTNPSFELAKKFIEKALELSENGNTIAMFLKLTFLEGIKRKQMFMDSPPQTVYISSSRLTTYRNGIETAGKDKEVGIAFIWCVWEKGYKGKTELKWFN